MRLIRPRWKKVFRDMWGNKSRTVLVIMSIAVGIFAIGVVAGSRQTLVDALNDSYLSTNPASGMVIVSDDFGDDLVETIDSLREVAIAEGRREFNLRYKLRPTDEWDQLEIRVVDDFEEMEIDKVRPESGKWPPPDEKLVIERSSLQLMGAAIGDEVIVQTSEEKERFMEIVGTAHDLSGPPAALTGQPAGFVSRETLEWLDEPRDYNRLLYTVSQHQTDRDHIELVGDTIGDKFEDANMEVRFIRVPPPGEHPVNNILEPLLMILLGLGSLALVLSGFLVINVISAMLAQQTRQIGIMKAIGARRSQIMGLYFVTVLIYGCLSLLVALPLGAVGAWALTSYLTAFFNTDLNNFTIPTSVLAVQIAIGLLVPLLVAIYPIMSGTRITVQEAISEYGMGQGKFGTSVIDRLLQQLRGLSRPAMISLRNTFRRKGRLSLTLLTLTLAGTIFITIFTIRDSMLATLDDTLAYWNFDVMVFFEDKYRIVEIERFAAQVPIITAVECWGRDSAVRIRPDGSQSDNLSIDAPPADTQIFQPEIMAGRWLRPADTTAIVINTDVLDDEPDLQVGDELVLEIDAQQTTWQIVGLVQGAMMGPTIYINQPYYARQISHEVGQASAVRMAVEPAAAENSQELVKYLEAEFDEADFDIFRIRTLSQLRARIDTAFNFFISFLLTMALVLAAVGGLGLSGTMSINVLERVREIGVMRAIGASDAAVLRLVLIEGLIIGFLSWLAGVIVAFPLSWFISYTVGISLMQKPLTFAFSGMGIIIWLILAAILAAIASFLPARGASRLTVREVLAYE